MMPCCDCSRAVTLDVCSGPWQLTGRSAQDDLEYVLEYSACFLHLPLLKLPALGQPAPLALYMSMSITLPADDHMALNAARALGWCATSMQVLCTACTAIFSRGSPRVNSVESMRERQAMPVLEMPRSQHG